MPTTPVTVFAVDGDLLLALESAFGPPIDSYLRGWQVWLEPVDAPDAPDGLELEYRLHPPGGFAQPVGLDHHFLWDEVVAQVAEGATTLTLGAEQRGLAQVWALLEVFPAFDEDVTAADVRRWAEQTLGRPALAHGDVDHDRLGANFTREGPAFDLPSALRAELGS